MALTTWLIGAQLFVTVAAGLYTLLSFVTGGRVRRWLRYGLGIDEVKDGLDDLRSRSDDLHNDVNEVQDDLSNVQVGLVAVGKAINNSREVDLARLERDVRDDGPVPRDYLQGSRQGSWRGDDDDDDDAAPMDDD